MTIKIIQWTSGGVARQCVKAIVNHPNLELIGMYAYSQNKVGKDVGELVGLKPLGITATDNIEELIALKPDCVSYSPLHPNIEHIEQLLAAGINIVTSAMFLTGWNISTKAGSAIPNAIERIEAAAQKGNASIFGSGMNPGYAGYLGCVLTGISHHIKHVKVDESVDVSLFAADSNMDALGWGLDPNTPNLKQQLMEETRVFGDGIDVMAAMLDVELDEKRCHVEFAVATEDLPIKGRPIAKGTVAAVNVRWEGLVNNKPLLELCQVWAMSSKLEPAWKIEHAYLVSVKGDPNVNARIDLFPEQDLATMQTEDFHAIGMTITGLPTINAIPAVCKAKAGIVTYADLPVICGAGRIKV